MKVLRTLGRFKLFLHICGCPSVNLAWEQCLCFSGGGPPCIKRDHHFLSTQLSHHGYDNDKVHQNNFVRIDIDKSILGNADEHTNIYNYINLFYESKQVTEEAESVILEFTTYQRSQFDPRWSPLKDLAQWDIEVPPNEATALSQRIWYEQAQQVNRTILAFSSILYEHSNTFMAFPSKLVKNAYTKGIPFSELINMLDFRV